jgi:GNAT superfamily N-acetyltransferase
LPEYRTVSDDHGAFMPRITDLARVRALLDDDPAWSAYAIGDLSPEHVANCSWHAPADGSCALALLYRGFDPPILFAMGGSAALVPIVREVEAPVVSLHVRGEALAVIASTYTSIETRAMWRMVVDRPAFQSASTAGVEAIEESDLAAITALYDDGRLHGEGPTFFHPSMLRQGTFRAVREGDEIVAIAGTHLFSPELGVCTVGNVYTRRDRRRRGLGARVTSAVVQHAIARAIPTIVLNVGQGNADARRVYERLGFRVHCEFFEGEARKGDSPREEGQSRPQQNVLAYWASRLYFFRIARS